MRQLLIGRSLPDLCDIFDKTSEAVKYDSQSVLETDEFSISRLEANFKVVVSERLCGVARNVDTGITRLDVIQMAQSAAGQPVSLRWRQNAADATNRSKLLGVAN